MMVHHGVIAERDVPDAHSRLRRYPLTAFRMP